MVTIIFKSSQKIHRSSNRRNFYHLRWICQNYNSLKLMVNLSRFESWFYRWLRIAGVFLKNSSIPSLIFEKFSSKDCFVEPFKYESKLIFLAQTRTMLFRQIALIFEEEIKKDSGIKLINGFKSNRSPLRASNVSFEIIGNVVFLPWLHHEPHCLVVH